MNYLTQVSWMHRSYGYPLSYGYHHAYGGGSWGMSLSQVVLLAVLVIGGIWWWNRNQGYRRW